MISGKWRNLLLATAMFNLGFVIWFSYAPFTSDISAEFGLSTGEIAVLIALATVIVPIGRIAVGPITDRFGAPIVACCTLVTAGSFSIVSAFATSYEVFTASRVVASLAGITFVIGIQHVAQWFDEENLGLAEGIFAGIGNAGAGLGAYFTLPRLFGEGYSDPLFTSNWRAAFFYTGVLAILLGVLYLIVGQAAKTEARRKAAKNGVSFRQWLYVATRHGAVVLSAAYVMTFGLEVAMNGWLGTYYGQGFGEGDLVIAATFAATFSITAGLLRPLGGYISDLLARRELNILPWFRGRYREQWTFATMSFVVLALFGMTAAGLTGNIYVAVLAGFFVGLGCAFSEGAIFAQVPAMFPDNSGTVAGVVGGIGTVGGSVYPLLFAAPFLPTLHLGYALVALTMIPILALCAWVFQPHIAEEATTSGWIVDEPGSSPDSRVINADD